MELRKDIKNPTMKRPYFALFKSKESIFIGLNVFYFFV